MTSPTHIWDVILNDEWRHVVSWVTQNVYSFHQITRGDVTSVDGEDPVADLHCSFPVTTDAINEAEQKTHKRLTKSLVTELKNTETRGKQPNWDSSRRFLDDKLLGTSTKGLSVLEHGRGRDRKRKYGATGKTAYPGEMWKLKNGRILGAMR